MVIAQDREPEQAGRTPPPVGAMRPLLRGEGPWHAVGMMSGTSLDGVDVALIETDGKDFVRRGPSRTYPYTDRERSILVDALASARGLLDRDARPPELAAAEAIVTERHAQAFAAFLESTGVVAEDIAVVGFHGQTVLHRPDAGLTVQIGAGEDLARRIGRPVMFDLRAADVSSGGQGAPLVPVYHRALAGALPDRPLAILNIGGVANITWIGADGDLIAFDTGPGGALVDDWVRRCTGGRERFDADGALAQRGSANEGVVRFFLDHDYFAAAPPKSLDRDTFFWDLVEWMSPEDGAATLTAMSAGAVATALEHLPARPVRIIACGGGRRNNALMREIEMRSGVETVRAEAAGFDGDSLEAEAWAYLAVRAALGLPITFPGTTGVPKPLTGGVLAEPCGSAVPADDYS